MGKAKQFVLVTQTATVQSVKGPSGLGYTSLKGKPFNVLIKEDQKFFEDSPRFSKPGSKANKSMDLERPEEKLHNLMKDAKMRKTSIDKVESQYTDIEELKAMIESQVGVQESLKLTDLEYEKLVGALFKEEE